MRKRTLIVVTTTCIGVVCLCAVFVLGARFGAQQFQLMDSSIQANFIVGELRALRDGSPEKLIASKEIELDAAIVRALQFQESGHSLVFWPAEASYEHERYLRSAATYRQLHPSPTSELHFAGDGERRELIERYRADVSRANRELLERYGR